MATTVPPSATETVSAVESAADTASSVSQNKVEQATTTVKSESNVVTTAARATATGATNSTSTSLQQASATAGDHVDGTLSQVGDSSTRTVQRVTQPDGTIVTTTTFVQGLEHSHFLAFHRLLTVFRAFLVRAGTEEVLVPTTVIEATSTMQEFGDTVVADTSPTARSQVDAAVEDRVTSVQQHTQPDGTMVTTTTTLVTQVAEEDPTIEDTQVHVLNLEGDVSALDLAGVDAPPAVITTASRTTRGAATHGRSAGAKGAHGKLAKTRSLRKKKKKKVSKVTRAGAGKASTTSGDGLQPSTLPLEGQTTTATTTTTSTTTTTHVPRYRYKTKVSRRGSRRQVQQQQHARSTRHGAHAPQRKAASQQREGDQQQQPVPAPPEGKPPQQQGPPSPPRRKRRYAPARESVLYAQRVYGAIPAGLQKTNKRSSHRSTSSRRRSRQAPSHSSRSRSSSHRSSQRSSNHSSQHSRQLPRLNTIITEPRHRRHARAAGPYTSRPAELPPAERHRPHTALASPAANKRRTPSPRRKFQRARSYRTRRSTKNKSLWATEKPEVEEEPTSATVTSATVTSTTAKSSSASATAIASDGRGAASKSPTRSRQRQPASPSRRERDANAASAQSQSSQRSDEQQRQRKRQLQQRQQQSISRLSHSHTTGTQQSQSQSTSSSASPRTGGSPSRPAFKGELQPHAPRSGRRTADWTSSPGPGAYEQSAFTIGAGARSQSSLSRAQTFSFGTSSRQSMRFATQEDRKAQATRFKGARQPHVPSQRVQSPTPGPGAYDAEPTLDAASVGGGATTGGRHRALSSASFSFSRASRDDLYRRRAKASGPGPGTYDVDAARGEEGLRSSMSSRGSSFRFSRAPRMPVSREDNGVPGPGAYEPDRERDIASRPSTSTHSRVLTFRFGSAPRDQVAQHVLRTAELPGPGAYDPDDRGLVTVEAHSFGTAPRGAGSKEAEAVPGPGAYTPRSPSADVSPGGAGSRRGKATFGTADRDAFLRTYYSGLQVRGGVAAVPVCASS